MSLKESSILVFCFLSFLPQLNFFTFLKKVNSDPLISKSNGLFPILTSWLYWLPPSLKIVLPLVFQAWFSPCSLTMSNCSFSTFMCFSSSYFYVSSLCTYICILFSSRMFSIASLTLTPNYVLVIPHIYRPY